MSNNVMFTFFCLTLIRPWLKLSTGGHGHVSFLSRKYSKRPHRDPQKFFFQYKQVSTRNDDHGWLGMTNAFILCDLVWKVQKGHAANREGSFNIWLFITSCGDCTLTYRG